MDTIMYMLEPCSPTIQKISSHLMYALLHSSTAVFRIYSSTVVSLKRATLFHPIVGGNHPTAYDINLNWHGLSDKKIELYFTSSNGKQGYGAEIKLYVRKKL